MPRKLFLLTDDRAYAKLRSASLTSGLVSPLGETANTGDETAIEWCEPEELVSHNSEEAQDQCDAPRDVEQRDRLFASLLGGVVCHLVVLENDPERVEAGDVELRDARAVHKLERWYESFQQEVEQRVSYRKHEYRHVLILVAADDVPHEQLAPLERMLAPSDGRRPIDACYVMLRRLNWGEQHVCHSRYVWPDCVARLLVYLMATELDAPPQAVNTTPILAWRGVELTPDIPREVIDREFHDRQADVYRRLFANDDNDIRGAWDQDAFDPDPDLRNIELEPPRIPSYQHWQTHDCERAVKGVASEDRWSAALHANGERFAHVVGGAALGDEQHSAEQGARVWRQLHSDPTILRVALQQRGIAQGPDVQQELDGLGRGLDELDRFATERERAVLDAKECAQVITEAQVCFVNRWVRGLLMVAAAAFVSYASIIVIGSLFSGWGDPQTWAAPALVAGAGVLGSVLAAVVPFLLERRAGERAVNTFTDDVLPKIDAAMVRSDWACQQLVERGYRYWAKARAASVARRIRLLLHRLKAMVDGELTVADPVIQAPKPRRPDEALSDGSREQQGRALREEFQRATSLRKAAHGFSIDNAELDQLVLSRCSAFVQAWGRMCERYDRRFAGHMPAKAWIPWLESFREDLHAAVAGRLYSQAVRQLIAEGDGWWVYGLKEFLNQDFSYYMSCPVTTPDTDHQRRSTRLLLRSEVRDTVLGGDLQDISVDHCEVVDRLPLFGLLFDEAPIRLGEVSGGYAGAVDYEG